ncbi:hypothetical protein NK6_9194 [Bradyrhizobium diazoefficiens]|uniref:Uncharacterized protein n=1 Tax=Bradyrhizobium diazoefficiens TaxID=1355477 RepID=A0A0E4BX51_9BRAD|nr:hypothetical protein NK6_9194 [Bradyrhizobium diazoefficiens]
MSFIGFGGAAGAAAFSGFAVSAGGGLASSSAMMRRIEARISSIEGSVTFAGCVISDSTSSTPSHALFYTKHGRIGRFRNGRPDIFVAAGRLVPISRLNVRRCAPALGTQALRTRHQVRGRIDPHLLGKAMSGILMIASKAPVGLGCLRG